MKKNLFYIFAVGLTVGLFSTLGFAQENRRTESDAASQYVVSAKPGGVNYVEGKVAVARKVGKSGYLLKGDNLEIGDKISTGTDGKAEILLNPGSFARLAENSVFEFATTSLEDLQLRLRSGSAIFEVITDNDFTVAVNTPKAKFYIVKTGVYRVDVQADGTGVIEVWKGKAEAGGNATEIKSGRQATVSGNELAIAKFDRDEKDALEIFSKTRAKELAKINARLENASVRTSLVNSFNQIGWSLYDSFGLWVYNARFGSYCFLPFGYGWSSPYGYFYPRDIWFYNLPPVIYNAPPTTAPSDVVSSADARARTRNQPASGEGEPPMQEPPYRKVQREIGTDSTPIRQIDPVPFPTGVPASPAPTMPVVTPARMPNKKGDN